MGYPQDPQAGYPQQGPPQGYPQPGYPPAAPAPGYPQPGYPQQGPPQGYPQAPAPGYPPQGYPQPGYPQAPGYPPQGPPPPVPQAPPVQTGMADFVHQPGIGGTNLQFPVKGHRHVVTVSRPLGDGDFPPQTTMPDAQGRSTVKTFGDNRPMVRMVVPVLVRPDAAHPDGHATLSVQGQMGEALKQAMALVGAGHLNGIPEDKSVIDVEFYDERPTKNPGYNPQKLYRVIYARPAGAAAAPSNGQQAQAAPNGNGNGQQAPAPAQPPYQVPPAPQAPYQPPAPQAPYQPPAAPPVPAYGQVAPGQPVSQPAPPPQGYPQQLIGQLQPPAPPAQGMMSPGQQVDYAAQQGLQAAQAAAPQPPVQQQGQPMAPPPNANPATQAAIAQLLGQPLPQ